MDHSLRTISYIADIGEILVIMARRRLIGSPGDTDSMRRRKQAKIICHVFESEEVRLNLNKNMTICCINNWVVYIYRIFTIIRC
jgi:hypothetical protein